MLFFFSFYKLGFEEQGEKEKNGIAFFLRKTQGHKSSAGAQAFGNISVDCSLQDINWVQNGVIKLEHVLLEKSESNMDWLLDRVWH